MVTKNGGRRERRLPDGRQYLFQVRLDRLRLLLLCIGFHRERIVLEIDLVRALGECDFFAHFGLR